MVFARMLDRIVDQVQNMGVGEGIDDCLSVPSPLHEARCRKNLETGRNRPNFHALRLRQIGHISLSLGEQNQSFQTQGVSQRLEHGRSSFKLIIWQRYHQTLNPIILSFFRLLNFRCQSVTPC